MPTANADRIVVLHNILLATDFSSTSEKAFRYAVAIATRYHSQLHLVHVIRPTVGEILAPGTISKTGEQLRQSAEEALRKQAEHLTNIPHQTHLLNGTVSECVEALVRIDHIDLAVVGTSRAHGLGKLLLGSTAEEIFRTATCPVLTVSPHVPATNVMPHRILFPADLLSDESDVLAHAVSLAKHYDANLTLLYVMADVQPPPPDQKESVEEPYFSRLQSLITDDVQLAHKVEYRIEYGDTAANVIVRVARELASDLIVLGVRPEESWATRLPDKAYRIVAGAPCPVLTMREKEGA